MQPLQSERILPKKFKNSLHVEEVKRHTLNRDGSIRNTRVKFEEGMEGTLYTKKDVSPGSKNKLVGVGIGPVEGIGGNMNSDIKKRTGWRGTTNDVSCHAHGLVRVTDIEEADDGNYYIVRFESISEDESTA